MVSRFTHQAGHLPSNKAAEPDERSLGFWLDRQKMRLDSGMMSGTQVAALHKAHPLLAERLERWRRIGRRIPKQVIGVVPWEDRFQQLCTFIVRTERLPKTQAVDPEERLLATFVGTQRVRLRKGTLTSEQARAMRQAHPLLRQRLDGWSRDSPLAP